MFQTNIYSAGNKTREQNEKLRDEISQNIQNLKYNHLCGEKKKKRGEGEKTLSVLTKIQKKIISFVMDKVSFLYQTELTSQTLL